MSYIPKTMCREDLLAMLRRGRTNGDRVILMMDYDLCKQLVVDDLKMHEVIPGSGAMTRLMEYGHCRTSK